MDEGLNCDSADGAGAQGVVDVAVALVAAAEGLRPGVARNAGVLLARPVPRALELVLAVGEQQGLFLAVGQLAADLLDAGGGEVRLTELSDAELLRLVRLDLESASIHG